MSFINKIKSLFKKKELSFEELLEKYDPLKKSSISFDIKNTYEGNSKSYFGGSPLVDSTFIWPTMNTDYYGDGEIKTRPLEFLLQIDCSELEEFDIDNLLPHHGLLLFFYNIESNRWGFQKEDKESFLVKYYENIDGLKEATLPEDISKEFVYPKCNIIFSFKNSYPTYDDLPKKYDSDEYEPFFEQINQEEDHHLLGYENNIQSSMMGECELISREYNLGHGYQDIPKEELEKVNQEAKKNWVLLLQLDSISNDKINMMFGDSGRLYFWIRKEDLENKKFDSCWMILQCY